MDLISPALLVISLLVFAQALFTLYLMLYSWEHPDRLRASGGPERLRPARTTFSVLLPALHTDLREADGLAAARSRPQRAQLRGHVLVVDDEQSVGTFMRDLLESWGLAVTVAGSAGEAMALITRGLSSFDLVITDHMMPRTTGLQLAHQLASLRPDIPVILYTGFNEGIPASQIEAAGIRAVLRKPVEPRELFGLLQTHLP